MDPSPADYLRIALDPLRLAVLGHAASGPIEIESLISRLAVDSTTLIKAVGRLRASGLLTEEGTLDRDRLRRVAAALPSFQAPASVVLDGPWTRDELEVLSRFFRGSRLTQIPASRAKRLVILERLVQEFEPGVRYDERRVNSILQVFHEDYASLRRHLVDEGMLTRADGYYWRSGGRYDPVSVG